MTLAPGAVLALLVLIDAVPVAPGGEAPRPGADRPRVALTFDDLPIHGPLPPGTSRIDIARGILAALAAAHAPPTYGFVNAKGLQDAPETGEFLRLWRAAGHPLGNHTFSHMDLHASSVEAFGQDVLANEPTLHGMGGGDWHWFRFPYLREGETLEKQRAVAAFLKDRGYRVAEVTISFDDYAYNEPYARCLARNDTAALDWLKESYLRRAGESLTAARAAAEGVFGRDIAHVMLLHVGGFQRVTLPGLLDLLQRRGFQLVTLEEAQRDPAYASDPGVAFASGATLLDRMTAARKVPAAPGPEPPFARLEALCR
jgi:peptidoglycan/xylan/chitin deacetylase (PgdA/CDA1 family)